MNQRRSEPRPAGRKVPAADATSVDLYLYRLPDGTDLEMVKVPEGEFLRRGSALADRIGAAYWIARHPATWREYRAFCRAVGKPEPRAPAWGAPDDHPVVNVSWHDASEFCRWAGLALPGRSQWEKAARGTDGREYPWGQGAPTASRCVWSGHPTLGGRSTSPVGTCPGGASPAGALDMAGNVWQWSHDETEVLAGGVAHYMPSDMSESEMFVTRLDPGPCGGSFRSGSDCCNASSVGRDPGTRSDDCGFRPVC